MKITATPLLVASLVALALMFSACGNKALSIDKADVETSAPSKISGGESSLTISSCPEVAAVNLKLRKTLESVFVVPVGHEVKDGKEVLLNAVKTHLSGEQEATVMRSIASKSMIVEVRANNEIPPLPLKMLSYTGAKQADIAKLQSAKNYIFIVTNSKPCWPPAFHFTCKSAAAALALAEKSVVFDTFFITLASAQNSMAAIPEPGKEPALRDWLQILSSNDSDGMWMTTRGMDLIGLPDFQALEAPPQLNNALNSVINMVALKIARMYGAQCEKSPNLATFSVPSTVTITEKDAKELCPEVESPKETTINLKLAQGKNTKPTTYLTLSPPADFKHSQGEYFVDICKALTGASKDGVVMFERNEAMEKATETAKAGIPQIRERFISKQLPLSVQLIVKFPVKKGDHTEFLWAYVTDWKNPDELDANCGNDCELDPTIKVGKQLHLKTNSLVDWAVQDGDKIVEGGWTNKVLGH